jgi:hypothetical protein
MSIGDMFAVYAPVNGPDYKGPEFHGLYHTRADANRVASRYPNAFTIRHFFDAAKGPRVYCYPLVRRGFLSFTNDLDELIRANRDTWREIAADPLRLEYDEMAPEEVRAREECMDIMRKMHASVRNQEDKEW